MVGAGATGQGVVAPGAVEVVVLGQAGQRLACCRVGTEEELTAFGLSVPRGAKSNLLTTGVILEVLVRGFFVGGGQTSGNVPGVAECQPGEHGGEVGVGFGERW